MGCYFVNGALRHRAGSRALIANFMRFEDSFYKPLTPEQSAAAFRNEHDFDSPEAIDFDILVDRLRDIKSGQVTAWTKTSSKALLIHGQ